LAEQVGVLYLQSDMTETLDQTEHWRQTPEQQKNEHLEIEQSGPNQSV
jgi:hypothetical protein